MAKWAGRQNTLVSEVTDTEENKEKRIKEKMTV